MCTDAKQVFLVNVVSNGDNSLRGAFNGWFDTNLPVQVFADLDDAKAWIQKAIHDVLWIDDGTVIKVNNDVFVDTDFNDQLSIFGTGSGALIPWLTIDSIDGKFDFWITQVDVH